MVQKIETGDIFTELNENGEQWRIDGDWRGKDLISVEQLSREAVDQVLVTADYLERLSKLEQKQVLAGKDVGVAFWQDSTRTYSSSVLAATRLGADVLGLHGMHAYSSTYKKGESLEKTIETLEALELNLIVLRHPDDDSGLRAAQVTKIPIVSGGAGKLEHPTQALLDVRTIRAETGRRAEDLHLVFVGDLKYGRTVHSLSKLMAIMGNKRMTLVATDEVKMPRGLVKWLVSQGVDVEETSDLRAAVREADIIYDTRVQREWFDSEEEYLKVKSAFQINSEVMKLVKSDAILMHPLPMVDEIAPEVDADPRAVYLPQQVNHGLWTRGAIMTLILEG